LSKKTIFGGAKAAAILLAAVLAAGQPGCSSEKNREEKPPAAPAARPSRAADLSGVELHALDGRTVTISDYSGKILFVTFLATWQEDSKKMIPILNEIQRKFGKNVQVLAIATDRQGTPALGTMLAGRDARFDAFCDGEAAAREFGSARDLPVTYILMRDGTLYKRIDGLTRQKQYEEYILEMYRKRL
jgi:thiol-disulfide isomerase/thioredoxin